MSIINQMLRDLDARQASQQERAGLPPQLRTLPPAHTRRSSAWGLLLFGGLAAGTAIAWLLAGQSPVPASASTAAPVVAPAAVAMTPPVAPATILPAPTSVQPQDVLNADVSELKLSTMLSPVDTPPDETPPAVTPTQEKVAPRQPEPVVKPAKKPAEKPMRATVTPPPAQPVAAAAGASHIEKQPKGGQIREQAETEYRKGVQAASQGDNVAALPALRRALELEPAHAKARQALLSVLASSRQWNELRQVAQSGLVLDPTKSGWASILARLQHEQGDTAAAVETLERHAAQAAGDADYQGLFAFLLQKRQHPAEAAQRYQAALALRPGEGRWWVGLGLALEAAGRGEEARTAFARARETGNLSKDMLGVVEQKLR